MALWLYTWNFIETSGNYALLRQIQHREIRCEKNNQFRKREALTNFY